MSPEPLPPLWATRPHVTASGSTSRDVWTKMAESERRRAIRSALLRSTETCRSTLMQMCVAERAQSATATCRLQNRSLFAYLPELITAHNHGHPFPALI